MRFIQGFFVTLWPNTHKNTAEIKRAKTALVSVFHKDGLEVLLAKPHSEGVKFLPTGGTQWFIEPLGYKCQTMESVASYLSILDGRVKTSHPKVFGGILARRENEGDHAQIQQCDTPAIDLVVIDLYPFEETVASGASEQEIIEKIDVGGIPLIRADTRNLSDVVIVPGKDEYGMLWDTPEKNGAQTTLEEGKQFAERAFGVSSHHDTAIHQWLAGQR